MYPRLPNGDVNLTEVGDERLVTAYGLLYDPSTAAHESLPQIGARHMNFKTKILLTTFSGALMLITVPRARGQAVATIQISGIVQASTGAVVPGVTVTATQTATGVSRRASTEPDGSYVMTQLPIGPYQLTAEKTGFKTYVQKG